MNGIMLDSKEHCQHFGMVVLGIWKLTKQAMAHCEM